MYLRTQSSATHCENAYEKITPLRTKGELQNAEVKGDQKGERDKFTIPQLWSEISTFNNQTQTNTNGRKEYHEAYLR